MVRIIIKFIFLIFPLFLFSQKDKKKITDSDFSIAIQTFGVSPTYDYDLPEQTGFELDYSTYVYGFNLLGIYNLSDYFAVNLGLSKEYITQPKFDYYQAFVGIRMYSSPTYNTLYIKSDYGLPFGNIEPGGMMFKASLGYRFNAFNKFLYYIDLGYSFQNTNKKIIGSNKEYGYYTIEGMVATIGFEFNIPRKKKNK